MKALGGQDVRYERTSTELKRALSFVASLGGNPHLSPCLCVGTYPILDGNFSRFRPGKRREFAKKLYETYTSIWDKHMHPGLYCDSFVSRPDGVGDLQYDALEYFTPQWQSVFEGQKVLLVRGGLPSKPSTLDKTVFSRHLKHAESVSELKSFKSARLHETVYLSRSLELFRGICWYSKCNSAEPSPGQIRRRGSLPWSNCFDSSSRAQLSWISSSGCRAVWRELFETLRLTFDPCWQLAFFYFFFLSVLCVAGS